MKAVDYSISASLDELIPHRGDISLLSKPLMSDEKKAVALVNISENSAFYDAQLGGVPAWVGVEYMAQTAAIWSGALRLEKDQPIEMGFLLGSPEYKARRPVFHCGEALLILVELQFRDDSGLGSFRCTITNSETGEEIVEATLNAYSPDNPGALIAQWKANGSA